MVSEKNKIMFELSAMFTGTKAFKQAEDAMRRVGVASGAITKKIEQSTKQFNSFNKVSVQSSTLMEKASIGSLKTMDAELASLKERGKAYTKQVTFAKKHVKNIDDVISDIDKKIPTQRREFAGWAMSLMFFGMALQRIFGTIRKQATAAFQEVMHSVEGTATDFDMLQGSLKYLGFVVGEALEPLTATLIPIIDAVSRWVEEHPRLTRVLVVFGTVLGGLFAVGGAGVLALNGFIELGAKLGFVELQANGAIKSIGGFSSFKEAFAALKTNINNVGTALKNAIINNFKWLKANPLKAGITAGLITGIAAAIIWNAKLIKEMGGVKEYAKNAARGFQKAWVMAILKVEQLKERIEWQKRGWSKEDAKEIAYRSYKADVEEFVGKLEENPPTKGWVEDSRTLAEIWRADLYPQVTELENAMNGVAAAVEAVKFSSEDIMRLFSAGLLSNENIGALLSADVVQEATLSDQSEKMLLDLYKQGTGDTFFIDKLSVESNADSINSILAGLKAGI
jgi:hypothetical protein